jgi:diguanylate cyclase (GGDEF)-like protein
MSNSSFAEYKKRIAKVTDFPSFLSENRRLVNTYMNKILWICILCGPAIALGIKFGVFTSATYLTCIIISVAMLIAALFHKLIIMKWPYSKHVAQITLITLELLLMFMVYNQIQIRLTWFFVPLLSFLFCEVKPFLTAVITNYIALFIANWIASPYYSGINSVFKTPQEYFLNTILGYTIETLVMLSAMLVLIKILECYFSDLLEKNKYAQSTSERLSSQMNILFSMAEIYDHVNVIDLKTMTETSLHEQNYHVHSLDMEQHSHTKMVHEIKMEVSEEHLERFLEFTNIRTLPQRLTGKRFIVDEFTNTNTGWFRAQYISAEADDNGVPVVVVFTVQNINMDKRREEALVRISLTDELTQLFNRRSLDSDLMKYKDSPMESNLVIASIDINRLKATNDSLGHAAGDELIRATAECLTTAIGSAGKVYRTGGDEFTAVIHSNDVPKIEKAIADEIKAWRGIYSSNLTISIGFASHKDYPDASVDELKKIADKIMYERKTEFYRKNGFERRRQ